VARLRAEVDSIRARVPPRDTAATGGAADTVSPAGGPAGAPVNSTPTAP
jgi:hypothetical protein